MTRPSRGSDDPRERRRCGGPRWSADVELMGPILDSGMRNPVFLVDRGDGQVIQLSELLNLVLAELDPRSNAG